MDVKEFYVSIEPESVLDLIQTHIVDGSFSGKVIDVYERIVGNQQLVVCIIEKYYMRSSNRASLTITVDNLEGKTKVHAVASGGGEGAFFRFDWGAGNSFVNSVVRALEEYIIEN
ncbi:hypothetical protein JFL43_06855 [Viridibacillus sp. YIM B01967]|uniref:Uncharacterized protein n=1 Tax=Viridibacillus soli TaxID=2798301 RepID=A0ABS1H5A1_9BACL|nr:DUF6054 family protein [Viridibacillus soli]MBK3494576.1 hypothetical protein [Viridibacillus soli]